MSSAKLEMSAAGNYNQYCRESQYNYVRMQNTKDTDVKQYFLQF